MIGANLRYGKHFKALTSNAIHPLPGRLAKLKTIVCLGDSLTSRGQNPGGWVWLLGRYLESMYPKAGIVVINKGVSGELSAEICARYNNVVKSCKPDLLILFAGTNDLIHKIPTSTSLANFESTIAAAKADHVPLMIISLPYPCEGRRKDSDFDRNSEELNHQLKTLCSEQDVELLDIRPEFISIIQQYQKSTGACDNFLTEDGVHFTGSGNQILANMLLTRLGVTAEERSKVFTNEISE